MKGSYGGELSLQRIRLIIQSMFKEINRLQDQLELDGVTMKNLLNEINSIKDKMAGNVKSEQTDEDTV
jgi:hypothetical protein